MACRHMSKSETLGEPLKNKTCPGALGEPLKNETPPLKNESPGPVGRTIEKRNPSRRVGRTIEKRNPSRRVGRTIEKRPLLRRPVGRTIEKRIPPPGPLSRPVLTNPGLLGEPLKKKSEPIIKQGNRLKGAIRVQLWCKRVQSQKRAKTRKNRPSWASCWWYNPEVHQKQPLDFFRASATSEDLNLLQRQRQGENFPGKLQPW